MTKRIIKYSLSVLLLSMCLTLVPIGADLSTANKAEAAGWWDSVNNGGLKDVAPAYGQGAGTPSEDIRFIVARLIRVVLELLGIIALVIIIIAGFKWMTAGGDETKIEESKKMMTNGIIGLVIIFAAFAIATFVFYMLQYSTTGIRPMTWSF